MSDSKPNGDKQPSLAPGVVLLVLTPALIVFLIVNPDMSDGLRYTIAAVAIALVVILLGYAGYVFYQSMKRGHK